ncbi:prolipoprotein diacylglyceryl transferase [Candidatus Berkelbacteria bacterium]|nr:prolipoprotein diacylglyceryl transferase [Candidatus Berkelbacteria bacterium]
MLPILFEVGSFKFYSFGTFIAVGTIIAGIFLFKAAKSRKMVTHHLFDTVLFTLLFALLGARITYFFIYQDEFQGFAQLFLFWKGGLVALGGFISGFLAFLYHAKRERDPIWQVLDIAALSLLVGWSVGKFGCFLSECSLGRISSSLFTINGSFPIDLFSSIWAAVVFVVMYRIWLKNRLSEGVVFFLSMEALFLGTLLINTLRLDFGDGIIRVEAILNLAIIVTIYLLFWKLHGPKIERRRFGLAIKNFVFKRRRD